MAKRPKKVALPARLSDGRLEHIADIIHAYARENRNSLSSDTHTRMIRGFIVEAVKVLEAEVERLTLDNRSLRKTVKEIRFLREFTSEHFLSGLEKSCQPSKTKLPPA